MYYVLNLKYASKLGNTLEFYQRYGLSIAKAEWYIPQTIRPHLNTKFKEYYVNVNLKALSFESVQCFQGGCWDTSRERKQEAAQELPQQEGRQSANITWRV